MMPTWFVASWDSLVHTLLFLEQDMAQGLVRSGWMTSVVKEQSLHCLNVRTEVGELTTVATMKMQVWIVSKTRR